MDCGDGGRCGRCAVRCGCWGCMRDCGCGCTDLMRDLARSDTQATNRPTTTTGSFMARRTEHCVDSSGQGPPAWQ